MNRLLNRKWGVLLMVAAMKTFTTHTVLTMWPSSRLPLLTFHLDSKRFWCKHKVIDKCAHAFWHGFSVASWKIKTHNNTSDASNLFSVVAMKKTSTTTSKNTVVTSAVRQTGQPAFVYMWTTRRYRHSSFFALCERKDAGARSAPRGEAPAPTPPVLRYDLNAWT